MHAVFQITKTTEKSQFIQRYALINLKLVVSCGHMTLFQPHHHPTSRINFRTSHLVPPP